MTDDPLQDTLLGEGAPEEVVVTGGTFDIPHQYLDDNPTNTGSDQYTINVTLKDDDTGTDTDSATSTITNLAPVIDTLSATSGLLAGATSTDFTKAQRSQLERLHVPSCPS